MIFPNLHHIIFFNSFEASAVDTRVKTGDNVAVPLIRQKRLYPIAYMQRILLLKNHALFAYMPCFHPLTIEVSL